ncbi:hypothetical protein E2C01_045132 [Portunus trituberculatus]|uniref:Uncharacterized protein n=1 Tax=Portunus trituberculatus TaxID=210409 RepID=A0A5B7G158_PORTR|nr:hypothetical protein [Portunus trituberculatus]
MATTQAALTWRGAPGQYLLAGGRCEDAVDGACHAGATSAGSGGPSRSARATSSCARQPQPSWRPRSPPLGEDVMAITSFLRHFVSLGAAPPARHLLLESGLGVAVTLKEHVYWKCKQCGLKGRKPCRQQDNNGRRHACSGRPSSTATLLSHARRSNTCSQTGDEDSTGPTCRPAA